jgi:glycosyltransferase involved in cell wall biosynthesis
MRVFYDSEIFLLQNSGGVSRYFSEIFSNFYSDTSLDIQPSLTFRKSNNLHLIESHRRLNLKLTPSTFPYPAPISPKRALITYGPVKFLSSALASNPYLAPARESMFHATYYRPNFLESLGKEFLAITVHDFIPEKLAWNGIKNPHIGKKSLAKRADLIFCVSKATAEEMQTFYGDLRADIRIVPHGVSNLGDVNSKTSASKVPSVIYVGHRSGYKNFIQLSTALRELWRQGIEVDLITVGPSFSDDEVREFIGPENLGFWRHFTKVSDELLFSLYREASVFCMTSKMEGFGIPILEALSQGTGVVLSDIPVAWEVAGEAGTYFEIGDVESLKSALVRGIETARDQEKILERIQHASRFTWHRTAQKMAEGYKAFDN